MSRSMQQFTRRKFLEFLGHSSLTVAGSSVLNSSLLTAKTAPKFTIEPLPASQKDALQLCPGLKYEILLSFGDLLHEKRQAYFGYDNDFLALMPISDKEALLWVNHEGIDPLLVCGYDGKGKKSKEQVDQERAAVGGSVVHLYLDHKNRWRVSRNHHLNRRIDATTPFPMVKRGNPPTETAIGTLANCSGGITPWGNILTCEENIEYFYGDYNLEALSKGQTEFTHEGYLDWRSFYPLPPSHYGWVVEIDPKTGQGKKLTALGRFAHEGARVVTAKDGRCVVYMGDDANDECIYKFIAERVGDLLDGTLYVADLKKGAWLPLEREQQPILKETFKSHENLLIATRHAAKLVGGTPTDRPEAIAVNPANQDILVCLTNNIPKNRPYGSILKIAEHSADPLSLTFTASTFISGGLESGFACPDNLVFDPQGNLWFTSDISENKIEKGPYQGFGNNSLFYVPLHKAQEKSRSNLKIGHPIRVANAPVDAEFTGPTFTADGKTLFLSVQHPGRRSENLKQLTSHWPHGAVPKGSVVTISGPLLDELTVIRT